MILLIARAEREIQYEVKYLYAIIIHIKLCKFLAQVKKLLKAIVA
jgi:hypothetical protein